MPSRSVLLLAAGFCLAGAMLAVAEDEVPAPDAAVDAPAETPVQTTRLPELIVIGRMLEDDLPQVPLESVASRDIFGPARIRETGARDMNDLIQNVPAISTRPYNGGEAAAPSFSMRGLPDDGLTEYIHLLIDGVPASPQPYGWTAPSFLPVTPERVHALDYLRGGHTLRYSPNTVSGVLNFITQPIPEEFRTEARSTFGSDGYVSNRLSTGATTGDFGWLATYVHRQGDGYRDDGEFRQNDANLKLRYDFNDTGWIATSLSYMKNEHQAPGGLTREQFERDRFGNARPENRFDGDRSVYDLVAHQGTGESGWIEAFGYFSHTYRNLHAQRPHFGVPATLSDWTDDGYFAAGGLRVAQPVQLLGTEHNLYGGFRYHREWLPHYKIRRRPFPEGPGPTIQDSGFEMDTWSAHLDDTFEPLPGLTVNAGVRLEWIPKAKGDDPITGWSFEEDFFALLPGAGVSYTLTEHWALYGNYYEGFRSPQFWGFSTTAPGEGLIFEKGRSAELGTRVQGYHGLSGSVAGWRVEYDDFGVYDTGFYENLGRIVAVGVDVVAEYELGPLVSALEGLSLTGSVTFQDSELRSGPTQGNETPYAWNEKAAWRLRYERAGWHASIGGTYVGESWSDAANTEAESADGRLGINPSRTLWDARLAKDIEVSKKVKIGVAIGATNLFDHDWFVHSRGGFFGPGMVAGAPLQEYASLDIVIEW